MKHGKKLLSILLALVLLCSLPYAVSATDSNITTYDKVMLTKKVVNANGYVDFYVTMSFSNYVHINNAGKIFFTYYYNPNTSHSYFWQESLIANSIAYEDTQVGADGLTYGKTVTGKFSVRPAYAAVMDASLTASKDHSWGVRITEYGFYANDGKVSSSVIADINGNGIQNTFHVNNNSDIAWQDLQTFTALEDIFIIGEYTASNGYKDYFVKMIFSDYVHINNAGKIFFTYHYAPSTGHSYFWQESLNTGSIVYEDAQVGADGVTYGKTVTGKFSVRPDYVSRMEASLAANEEYSFGVRFTEYDYYVNDGMVSSSVIQDMYGRGIESTIHMNNSSDITWCDTVAMAHVVSAVVQNANANTVDMLVTFSKPVSMPCKNYWDVMMRFNNATNGTNQQRMQKRTYVNPQTINGTTYSDQILITFNANGQPLDANVGVVFAEYNHHDNQHGSDSQISTNVAFDVNGIGLAPTEVTTCTNASTGCSNARVCLAYVKATLDEDAQAITSVSRVDDTHISVVFPMHVTSINTASAITLGSCQVTAVEGSAGAWTFTLDKAMTGSDAVLTIPAGAVTLGYNGQTVAKEMTASLPFTDQLQAGGTVTMTKDETVDELAIAEGVTLDLNGHTLTAGSVATITSTSAIIDSKNGEGGIAVAKDGLLFVGTNAQLPLYDNGVYRFFDCEMVHMQRAGQTSNSVMFGVRMELNDRAYALLEDSVASGAELTLQLASSAFDQPITYAFSADIVTEYAQNMQNNEGYWVIVLTVYGLDALDEGTELTVTPLLHSSTSVTMTGEALTYTK